MAFACQFKHSRYQTYHDRSEDGYDLAINYYKKQKENFIDFLQKQKVQDQSKILIPNLINSINQEIQTTIQNDEMFSKGSEYFDEFKNQIINYLMNGDKSKYQKDFSKALKASKVDKNTIAINAIERKKVKEIIERILSKQELDNLIQKTFEAKKITTEGAISSAQLNNLYGYARRVVYNQFKAKSIQAAPIVDKALNGYIKNFNGIFKEDIEKTSINSLLEKMGLSHLIEATTIGGDLGENKKQGSTDILITLFDKDLSLIQKSMNDLDTYLLEGLHNRLDKLSQSQSTIMQVNLFDPSNFIGAGIQSKSWISPLNIDSKTHIGPGYFSLGTRASAYQQASVMRKFKDGAKMGVYSWHYNIYALSRNVIPLLGAANILYSTKDGMWWTHDLIHQFKERQYYLSYYFKGSQGIFEQPATTEVIWQKEISVDKIKGYKFV